MYFTGLDTVGAVKSEYRRLAKKHHPDIGGLCAVMQAINAAYHAALEGLHGQESVGSDNKTHTYYYNESREQAVIDKISQLLDLHLPSDVVIELVGVWVWVHGNTRPHRKALSAAGCRWHSKRGRWYWREKGQRKRKYNKRASFADIRRAYGSRVFDSETEGSTAVA